jgi:hypothetical protein
MKQIKIVLMMAAVAALTAFATTKSLIRIGPFYTSTIAYDTLTGGAVGGEVRIYQNGVDTLIVGDVVYLSAQNKVRKSSTLANYNTIVGVVVGGSKTNMLAISSSPAATDTAALANGKAIVLSRGRAYVRVDAAVALSPGALIQPSVTVAGKVTVKAAPLDSLFRVFGRMVDTGVVSTSALANINVR